MLAQRASMSRAAAEFVRDSRSSRAAAEFVRSGSRSVHGKAWPGGEPHWCM